LLTLGTYLIVGTWYNQPLVVKGARPHYQQSCPPCLTDPPGGPPMTDAIALRPGAAG
jgi:hypothetical protein